MSRITSGPRQNYMDPHDVMAIASPPRVVMYGLLINILAVAAQFAIPRELHVFLLLGALAVGLIAGLFVMLLAAKLYNVGLGLLLGLLAMVPIVNLIVLLLVNGKATRTLRGHGIPVGILGASS